MGKKLFHKIDYEVIVTPKGLGNWGSVRVSDDFLYGRDEKGRRRIEAEYESNCKDIIDQIERHVDGVHHAQVRSESEYVCEYCGFGWTEDSDTYNGGCCAEDERNNPDYEPSYYVIEWQAGKGILGFIEIKGSLDQATDLANRAYGLMKQSSEPGVYCALVVECLYQLTSESVGQFVDVNGELVYTNALYQAGSM